VIASENTLSFKSSGFGKIF